MAISITGNSKDLVTELVKVAQATGNPKLDVTYLCADTCPYFRFTSSVGNRSYYTIIHPDANDTTAREVTVYALRKNHTFTDGSEGEYMEQIGTGTQTGTTLTYLGINTYQDYRDVRLHATNKWARYKPILAKGKEILNLDNIPSDRSATINTYYGLAIPDEAAKWQDVMNCTFDYTGLPSVDNSNNDNIYARLTDFNGYEHNAKPTLWGEMAERTEGYTKLLFPIITQPSSSGAVDFNAIVAMIFSASVNISSLYPALLVDSGEALTYYLRVLLPYAGESNTPVTIGDNPNGNWKIDLTNVPNLPTTGTASVVATVVLIDKVNEVTSAWKAVEKAGPTGGIAGGIKAAIPVPNATFRNITVPIAPTMYTFNYIFYQEQTNNRYTFTFSVAGESDEGLEYYCTLTGMTPTSQRIYPVGSQVDVTVRRVGLGTSTTARIYAKESGGTQEFLAYQSGTIEL